MEPKMAKELSSVRKRVVRWGVRYLGGAVLKSLEYKCPASGERFY